MPTSPLAPFQHGNPVHRNKYEEGFMVKSTRLTAVLLGAMLFLMGIAFAQTDPGVQTASRGTGAALSSVLANDNPGILDFFNDGLARFQAVESVSNSPTGNNGLGPRFNSTSCSSCH